MINSIKIKKLYDEIVSSTNHGGNSIWNDILEVLRKEMNKNLNTECVSLKKAIRLYLGASSDYDNSWFTNLCEVQDELEKYYDELVIQFIKDNSTLSEKRVEKMIKDLKIHFDLYSEIVEYILAGNTYKKDTIKVEGYDAAGLCSNYKLSLVGAYNFLIYLREDPSNALADLKAGLPRR
jgi:hypothetical protein